MPSPTPAGTAPPARQITAGFTLHDGLDLIRRSLADPAVLGWFFHLRPGAEIGKRMPRISDIRLTRLTSTTLNGREVLRHEPVVGSKGAPLIRPKKHDQLQRPDLPGTASVSDFRAHSYQRAVGYCDGIFRAEDAALTDLDHYVSWAEAVFFRRSDLDLMRLVVLHSGGAYNDLFFSGARVDFGAMTNARHRIRQFTLQNGGVSDSSRAFTLKGEPILNEIDGPAPGPDVSDEPSPRANGSRAVMLPSVMLGYPGPDYWEELDTLPATTNAIGI